jgi:hypothetical protein
MRHLSTDYASLISRDSGPGAGQISWFQTRRSQGSGAIILIISIRRRPGETQGLTRPLAGGIS